VEFLEQQFSDSTRRIVLADYVAVELYVLLRNPAVMRRPLSAPAARNVATAYWSHPNVVRVENAEVMNEVWEAAGSKGFGRRRIFDLRLALTLRKAGVEEFATFNVKDFEGLGFQRVWNPLR
jgi:predicted nucleic acid-binding protein